MVVFRADEQTHLFFLIAWPIRFSRFRRLSYLGGYHAIAMRDALDEVETSELTISNYLCCVFQMTRSVTKRDVYISPPNLLGKAVAECGLALAFHPACICFYSRLKRDPLSALG